MKVIKCCISNRSYYIDVVTALASLPIDRHAKAALCLFWWNHFCKQHAFHYIPIYVLPVHNSFWEARNIQARNWLMFSACCLWRHVIKISFSCGSRITLCFISHVIDCRVVALWANIASFRLSFLCSSDECECWQMVVFSSVATC